MTFFAVSCSGSDGKDGLPSLTVVSEATPEDCPTGGTTIATGLDADRDGTLDAEEITSWRHVCEGAGSLDLLVVVTPEPPSEACPYGGERITSGLDQNQNGQLDEAEVAATEYACHARVLTEIHAEPRCFPGGERHVTGYDLDDDGHLTGAEVTSESLAGCVYYRATSLIGTVEDEVDARVATDSHGNVWVAGGTLGDLEGASAGLSDVFVRKFDAAGVLLWTRQFGSNGEEFVGGIQVDGAGNAYIVGGTTGNYEGIGIGGLDAFVTKLSPDGDELWSRQFGTFENDNGLGVAVDSSGQVLIAGRTFGDMAGNLGFYDGFLRKYDATGTPLWTRQFGSSNIEFISSVVVTPGDDVVVVGFTPGNFAGVTNGNFDILATRYTADGALVWARQFGSPDDDYAWSVASLDDGSVIIGGQTDGDWFRQSAGGIDGVMLLVSAGGELVRGVQLGSSGDDFFFGVAADASGRVFFTGVTEGSLYGPNPDAGKQPVLLVSDASLYVSAALQLNVTGETSDTAVAVGPTGTLFWVGAADATGLEGLQTAGSDLFLSILEPR